jgi:hypothetical protein
MFANDDVTSRGAAIFGMTLGFCRGAPWVNNRMVKGKMPDALAGGGTRN